MLDTQARKLNLGLAPAQPFQVVRMVDLPFAPEPDGPRQYAAAADGGRDAIKYDFGRRS